MAYRTNAAPVVAVPTRASFNSSWGRFLVATATAAACIFAVQAGNIHGDIGGCVAGAVVSLSIQAAMWWSHRRGKGDV
jgi:hypothetical protein